MIVSYALNAHRVGQSVKAAAFKYRGKHWRNCLDIVYVGEKDIQVILEHLPVERQEIICQCPQKICEILVAMEADPMHAIIQHHPRLNNLLCKIYRVDAPALQFLEINPTFFEDVYGVHGF